MDNHLDGSSVSELLLWILRLRRRFRVTGASMYPLLRPGDEVLVDPRAYRKMPPRPGDIIVMRHPFRKGVRVVKRVTEVFEDGRFLVRGDDPLESEDSRTFGAVAPESIIGKVTGRFP